MLPLWRKFCTVLYLVALNLCAQCKIEEVHLFNNETFGVGQRTLQQVADYGGEVLPAVRLIDSHALLPPLNHSLIARSCVRSLARVMAAPRPGRPVTTRGIRIHILRLLA